MTESMHLHGLTCEKNLQEQLPACIGKAMAVRAARAACNLHPTCTYFSADRWQMRTYRPNGSASELPKKPRPSPTYVKKDDMVNVF